MHVVVLGATGNVGTAVVERCASTVTSSTWSASPVAFPDRHSTSMA